MFKKLYTKFPFLSPHYKMERFIVSTTSLLLCLLLVTGVIVMKHKNDVKSMMTGRTQYTEDIITSKTGHTGQVIGVYNNQDSTKCFVLMKWDSMDTMSRKVADYQLYLTGSNINMGKTKLQSNPEASLYIFGSTGYMGVYLIDANGFANQIEKLTIRCNQELTATIQDLSAIGDDSYKVYDMADIYFNPGGSDKIVMDFLDGDMNTKDMYYAMLMKAQEDTLRANLNDKLQTLQTDLSLCSEYERRLDEDGIKWSDTKDRQIKNDSVTAYKDDETLLSLNTSYTCAGGLNFEWQDGNIYDGYLDDLTDLSFGAFVEKAQNAIVEKPNYAQAVWYKKDGSVFEYDSKTLSSVNASINGDIQNCMNSWVTYYEHKTDYQKLLLDLVVLEHNLDEDWSIYDVETSLQDGTLMTIY